MATTATAIQTGINMFQVGALRMPFMFASASAALIIGEVAFRGIKEVLGALGMTGNEGLSKRIYDNTPEWVGKIVRPFRDPTQYPIKTLVIYGIVATIIGALGTDLVNLAFGAPPAIYNRVLTLMGNIRISTDLHPATQWAMGRLGF